MNMERFEKCHPLLLSHLLSILPDRRTENLRSMNSRSARAMLILLGADGISVETEIGQYEPMIHDLWRGDLEFVLENFENEIETKATIRINFE